MNASKHWSEMDARDPEENIWWLFEACFEDSDDSDSDSDDEEPEGTSGGDN